MDDCLTRLAKLKILGLLAIAAMLHACGLPAVKPQMAPGFEEGKVQVKAVAVMPVDFGVTRNEKNDLTRASPDAEERLADKMVKGLVEALKRRGYLVPAVLRSDRLEHHVDFLEQDELAGLRVQIHRSSRRAAIEEGVTLPEPAAGMIQFLGEQTGTDATVYARGWAYVDPGSGAGVGTVLAVLLVVFVVFVLVAALAKSSGGGKSKSRSSKSCKRSAKSAGRSSSRARHTLRPKRGSGAAERPHGGRVKDKSCRRSCRGRSPRSAARGLARGMHETTRIFADAATEVDVNIVVQPSEERQFIEPPAVEPEPRPVESWSDVIEEEIKACPEPAPNTSTLGISISLVHNATGQVLWHGDQMFDIAADGQKLQLLMEHFMKKLPRAPDWPVRSDRDRPPGD